MLVDRRSTLALIGAGVLVGCGRSGSAFLRVGSQRAGTKSLMEASGVLAGLPFTIEWAEFPASQQLLEALAAGAIDLGGMGDAPFLFAYQGGSPIRSVRATQHQPHSTDLAIIVPGDSSIRAVQELAGRTVATGRGSAGHYLLLRVIEKANIPLASVKMVFLSPGDAKSALASGAVDAWSTWNPYAAAELLHGDGRILVDGRKYVAGFGFIAAPERAIEAKRAQIADFLNRYVQAEAWASGNIGAYAAVLKRETGLPADVAYQVANRTRIAVRTDSRVIQVEREVLETFARTGTVKITRALEPAFDTSFDKGLPTA